MPGNALNLFRVRKIQPAMECPAESRPGSGFIVALMLWGLAILFAPHWATGAGSEKDCSFPGQVGRRPGGLVEVACFESATEGPTLAGAPGLLFGLPLDLNRAKPVALESLPGIGPSRAQAIVRERCSGGFESLESVARIRGIGRRTVEGLRGWAVAESTPECLEPKSGAQ